MTECIKIEIDEWTVTECMKRWMDERRNREMDG